MRESRREELELDRDQTLTDIALLLREAITILQDIREIQRDAHTLDGTTITNNFTIPMGAPVVKFHFVDSQFHKNVPRGASFEVPENPVQQMVLNNMGPGILSYSTNKFLNQLEAASRLQPGETRAISLPKRAIKQLNLAANGGSCDVRLELLM